jgi:hypothetical protein
MGYNINGFHASKLSSMPLDRRTIVKGSIRTVRMALWHLGCEQPENVDIPDSLRNYTHRKIWKTTMGAVRKMRSPVFIKPLEVQKAFNGHIYGREPSKTAKLPNNYKVLASEVTTFQAEWRVYILRKKVLGIHLYYHTANEPPINLIKEMIRAYKDAPAAYAMDIGLINHPKPVHALVEVNEGFSLGNYGIPDIDYARMVEARWKEMTNT